MIRLFAKAIYLTGILFVNPLIFKRYSDLKKTEFYSDDALDNMQQRKLQKLISHAKQHSPYYSESLRDIDVSSITLKNLERLPILTKDDLRNCSDEIHSTNFLKSDLIKSETSGSTGDPFVFYRDKQWDAAHRAAIWRGIEQHGVRPWNRNLYLWGFIFDKKSTRKIRALDYLQNRFRIFQITKSELKKNLPKLKHVHFVSGYSSVIDSLVKLIEETNTRLPKLKMLKGTSEKIYPSYQSRAKRVLGIPIVSEYGAAETGIISYSCTEGINHTVRENVIVECVDGRAVITNLESYSMPIIRFDLGDYIEIDEVQCKCGRHSQVITEILGRVGKSIFGVSKEYPSLTLYYIFKDLALLHDVMLSYQAIQSAKGKLQLLIFDNLINVDVELIKIISKKYLPDVEIEIVQGSADERDAKLKDFVSHL